MDMGLVMIAGDLFTGQNSSNYASRHDGDRRATEGVRAAH